MTLDFAFDDGGRLKAGFKGSARDCVVRALAIATGKPYGDLYSELATARAATGKPRSARNGIARNVYEPIFAAHGLRKVKLPPGPRPTFGEAHAKFGDCIVSTRKHVCALINGALRDTNDWRTVTWFDDRLWPHVSERKALAVYAVDRQERKRHDWDDFTLPPARYACQVCRVFYPPHDLFWVSEEDDDGAFGWTCRNCLPYCGELKAERLDNLNDAIESRTL